MTSSQYIKVTIVQKYHKATTSLGSRYSQIVLKPKSHARVGLDVRLMGCFDSSSTTLSYLFPSYTPLMYLLQ